MYDDLFGKCALVTGASAGLGAHFARLLARRGARVVLAARRIDALTRLRHEIVEAGGIAETALLDVTNADSVNAVFTELTVSPDIIVNNAGTADSCPALEMDTLHWDRVVDTNLRGVFVVAQAAARRMRDEGRSGSIINIASIVGLRPAGNLSAYAASKAGTIHLTRSLALEWARFGIRVNALCPGYVETEINRDFFATPAGEALVKRIPQRRLGHANELDGALLLFASNAGSYITGASLAVDGGHLVSSL
ncbi:2-deoxy-D-gluconate 3-dehydrogenase [Bradyrhizobium sp. NAS80.1]|uniref:SDR family NAD(P)-dependent oxidoreductase n=1 Tax=Bradyrhizobium sp. NAS80.1 TaxID=1680159 RepID=UPI00095CB8E2|nr:SDR family oxidoreductase [Bradyrhizobium sp. NAS80.1]OKO75510.1 2-deoxy-D-gluconate 3-dehydrogenase [Bradyrhizobium sp. NAS80.1]